MTIEEFATEYEKEYFNFYYALQSENKNTKKYIQKIEGLFEKLEKEMKKLAKNQPVSVFKTFSIADDCLFGYNNIIKRTNDPIIKQYCSKKLKLVKEARIVLSHLFPKCTIEELYEESKDEEYHPKKY
ncbi:MAG: hypothetical protein N3G19_01870 [Candidatus Pacearchaeota archaeon]|nr:hypothetical protein [Candidatus Pacearchaeota archaeon]